MSESILPTASQDAFDTLTFESALSELENIVRKLEEGHIPLEEAVALYEKGAYLKAHCETKLKNAQLKIEKIIAKGEEIGTVPFDPTNADTPDIREG
ncbi:MAG: exodeoxyribonuclease VII small subunit [Holosporales bacterium]|jgi:exodeoxyribonuclease VII small subunit|nr:exodeoxyribonuclease VII small subunit [Holosporales bacterium]